MSIFKKEFSIEELETRLEMGKCRGGITIKCKKC